jgi:hypothetical protein
MFLIIISCNLICDLINLLYSLGITHYKPCHRSSAWYERVLGKHEVAGPNPVGGFYLENLNNAYVKLGWLI